MEMAADDDVDGNHTLARESECERKMAQEKEKEKRTSAAAAAATAAAEERVRIKTLTGRSRSIATTIVLYQAPHFVLLTGARDGLCE